MLKDIRIEINEPNFIHCDNKSTVNMSKNLVLHCKTENISIKCHMLREEVAKKEIRLEYVRNKDYIVDIFTKLFSKRLLSICKVC